MEQDKFIYNGLEHGIGNCILSNVHSRIVANYFDKKLYITGDFKKFNSVRSKVVLDNEGWIEGKSNIKKFDRIYTVDYTAFWNLLNAFDIKLSKKEYYEQMFVGFQKIKFSEKVTDEFNLFKKGIDFNEMVGIHIRTLAPVEKWQNKVYCYAHSDYIDLYYNNIKKLLNQYQLDSVFLTGGTEYGVKSSINRKLAEDGINIVSDGVKYKRGDSRWERDMMCLSKCKCVISHEFSTYGLSSALMGGNSFYDMETLKKIG
jgi:hypothetical protein